MGIWVVSTFLAILNNAAINICMQASVCIHAFISRGYTLRNDIAEWYSNSMFNLLRKSETVSTVTVPFYMPTSNVFPFLKDCLKISILLG